MKTPKLKPAPEDDLSADAIFAPPEQICRTLIIADKVSQHHSEAFRAVIHLLRDCKSPQALYVRVRVLTDFLAGGCGDVSQLAKECRCSSRLIYKERTILKSLALSLSVKAGVQLYTPVSLKKSVV